MIDIDTPRMTIPTRERASTRSTWAVGDALTIGKTRWIIRVITGRRVELESANHVNHNIWWDTTVGKLPKKASA